MKFKLLLILVVFFISSAFAQIIGSFIYLRSIDPLTDADRSLILTSDTSTSSQKARMAWRCLDGKLQVYITTPQFLNSRAGVPVLYRFDKLPAINSIWSPSTEGTAAFVTGETETASFTLSALKAEDLVIRLTDYRGTQYTYFFKLTKMAEALNLLKCGQALLALQSQAAQNATAAIFVALDDLIKLFSIQSATGGDTLVLNYGSNTINLYFSKPEVTLPDGSTKVISASPVLRNNLTLIPIDALDPLGCSVVVSGQAVTVSCPNPSGFGSLRFVLQRY